MGLTGDPLKDPFVVDRGVGFGREVRVVVVDRKLGSDRSHVSVVNIGEVEGMQRRAFRRALVLGWETGVRDEVELSSVITVEKRITAAQVVPVRINSIAIDLSPLISTVKPGLSGNVSTSWDGIWLSRRGVVDLRRDVRDIKRCLVVRKRDVRDMSIEWEGVLLSRPGVVLLRDGRDIVL